MKTKTNQKIKSKIKSSDYQTLAIIFIDYAWSKFGRLENRISLESFAGWLDWKTANPDREFYRFERFL